MALAQWLNAFENPYPTVQAVLRSDGSQNFGNYSDPRVDDLLAQAEGTVDEAERDRACQQAELLAAQDLSHFWFSRSYLSTVTSPAVHGVDRCINRDMFYAGLWVDR